jgi:hypothetical protein
MAVGLCFSCENEQIPVENEPIHNACSNDELLAGDTVSEHFIIIELDTLLSDPYKACQDITYAIDIDMNGSNDVKITSFFCYSPAYVEGAFHIESVNPDLKILLNNSLENPEILELHDTVDVSLNAYPGRYELIRCVSLLNPATGEENHSCTGTWKYVHNYVGMVYNNGSYIYKCWLNVGLNGPGEPFGPQSIYLNNIGILKSCL